MTKLGITRLDGESEADFQRRYAREKMRIYRAAKPKAPRKPHGKHTRPPKNWTGTQAEWDEMQPIPGESADDHRKRYNRIKTARYRVAHAERLREERLADYAENKDAINVKVRARKAAKPEVYKAHSRAYFERNRDERIAKLKEWGRRNPDRLVAAQRRHREENPALYAAYSANWRRGCRAATPAWADYDLIQAVYDEAQRLTEATGIQHQVDHIVPITSKVVCGLHVQTNLRPLPAGDNSRKRNRLDHELVEALMRADIAALTPEET